MGMIGHRGAPSPLGLAKDPKALLAESLVENDGNLLQTAHDIGVSRMTVYRAIRRWELWPLVNKIRRERIRERRSRGRGRLHRVS
jgi:hypothetical protein